VVKGQYPECDKMQAVKEKSQAIGEFLEWLSEGRTPRVALVVPHSQEVDEEDEPVYRDRNGRVVLHWEERRFKAVHSGRKSEMEAMQREIDDRGIYRKMVPDPQGEQLLPLSVSTEEILAEFFSIDLRKVEAERRQMLRALAEIGKD
jgi:hypothetical protein